MSKNWGSARKSLSDSATAFPASGQFRNRTFYQKTDKLRQHRDLTKRRFGIISAPKFGRLWGCIDANPLAGLATWAANAREVAGFHDGCRAHSRPGHRCEHSNLQRGGCRPPASTRVQGFAFARQRLGKIREARHSAEQYLRARILGLARSQ